MSISNRQEQLDVLAEVSRRMRDNAESGDWETVNHLQETSLQLAGKLFSEDIPDTDIQTVANVVNEVLKINQSILSMGVDARDKCLGELEQIQQNRRAVKEYAANTG